MVCFVLLNRLNMSLCGLRNEANNCTRDSSGISGLRSRIDAFNLGPHHLTSEAWIPNLSSGAIAQRCEGVVERAD